MELGRFDGQVAIITGAAHGIGFAAAQVLGARGATTVLVDIDGPKVEGAAQRLREDGLAAIALSADLTVEHEVMDLVGAVLAEYETVDILVNLAGIQPPFIRFEDQTFEHWHKVLAATLDTSFLCCREVLPHMKAAGFGRIVNTSSNSINAGGAGDAPYVPYVTAKAGIIGMTRALAREVGGFGITANVLMPGLTETELTLSRITDAEFDAGVAKQCVKRRATAVDVANSIAFMVGPDSGFLTGQVVNVSGGQYFN
jgi:3-oxoacyl-[acyl-carrier protein] reductase